MAFKIGVLLPNSNFYTTIGQDYTNGIKAGLAAFPEFEYELVLDLGGYNSDKNLVTDKINRFIIQHQVDVIFGIVGSGILDAVYTNIDNYKVPVFFNNMGADFYPAEFHSDSIWWHTMNMWQCEWAMGNWAARNIGKKVCNIACFHEAGYDLNNAFMKGFLSEGGEPLYTAVTHKAKRDEDAKQAIEAVYNCEPDVLHALYTSKEAGSFSRQYKELGYNGSIPMVAVGTFGDQEWASMLDESAAGTKSAFSWDFHSTSPENQAFKAAYGAINPKAPNPFSLMAYETAQMFAQVAKDMTSAQIKGPEFVKAMTELVYHGPRGQQQYDPVSHELNSKVMLFELAKNAEGLYNKMLAEITLPEAYQKDQEENKKREKVGWLNPYLVA